MKPFLILQIRENDQASQGEFEAFLRFGGLKKQEVERIRMEQTGIDRNIHATDYAGIIVGGGPYNVSDAQQKKSAQQQRVEADLTRLLQEVIEADVPFLGACYGFGALANHLNGSVSKERFAESVGATHIQLTPEAKHDPLTRGLPERFLAFGGHKEACQALPKDAVLLASSDSCPVQLFRVKNHIYAVQFHPELDVEGVILRIHVYKNAGYFPPEAAEPLIEEVKKTSITVPQQIMHRFVNIAREKAQ